MVYEDNTVQVLTVENGSMDIDYFRASIVLLNKIYLVHLEYLMLTTFTFFQVAYVHLLCIKVLLGPISHCGQIRVYKRKFQACYCHECDSCIWKIL